MEDKKILKDKELEKVVGGEIESANVVGYGVAAPELPAQQLSDNVYQKMFKAVYEPDSSEPQPHDCSGLIS